MPKKTRAALDLLDRMTCKPHSIDKSFIDHLRKEGLSSLAIQEAANVGFHYNLIDRVADAFNFPIPEGIYLKRLARMLNFTGLLVRGSPAKETWVLGDGGIKRAPEVELGRKRLLEAPGATTPGLRRAVEAYVLDKWDVDRGSREVLPPNLEPYLDKLALQAYKIVDQDFDDLRGAGYSDEKIYEITIVGSTAAALVGLETLYQVLY